MKEKDERHFSTSSTRTIVFQTPSREISAQPPRQRPRWLVERQAEGRTLLRERAKRNRNGPRFSRFRDIVVERSGRALWKLKGKIKPDSIKIHRRRLESSGNAVRGRGLCKPRRERVFHFRSQSYVVTLIPFLSTGPSRDSPR